MNVMAAQGPKTGKYNDGRLWFSRSGNVMTLGLTSLATDELGEINRVDLPDEGQEFIKGEVVAFLEGTGGSLEVTSPAVGLVSEVNEEVKENAAIIEEDPLEEGWLVRLEIEDASDLKEYAAEDDS